MKCPFKEQVDNGTMVCDKGYSHCYNTEQCPTDIFNKCQDDANNEALINK